VLCPHSSREGQVQVPASAAALWASNPSIADEHAVAILDVDAQPTGRTAGIVGVAHRPDVRAIDTAHDLKPRVLLRNGLATEESALFAAWLTWSRASATLTAC
jgi:hypothetical protein